MGIRPMINNFTAGECSPLMFGRVDFEKYDNMCELLENFIIHPQGPVQNRSGFRFVAKAKGTTVRLIPFQYSTGDNYILELGHDGAAGYIRFFRQWGQIVKAFADATELVTDGSFGGIGDWTALNGAALASVAGGAVGNCGQITENGTSNPGVAQTIAVAEHSEYRFRAYVKQGTEATYRYKIRDMTNGEYIYESDDAEAPAAWSGAVPDISKDFFTPIGCVSVRFEIYQVAAAGAATTLLVDLVQLRRIDDPYEIVSPFAADDIPYVNFCQSADTMYLAHPSYALRKLTRSGHTNWTLATPALVTGGTTDLNSAADKYPACCVFHENRFVLARTNNKLNTIYFSKSGSFEDFTIGTNDEDAIEVALASDQVNSIMWLVSSLVLIVGTAGGVWRVSATDENYPILPTDITAKRERVLGAANLRPCQVGANVLFLQLAERKIHRLAYDWQSAGYVSPDMTVLAEHISKGGIWEIAYHPEPYGILWCVRNDGELPGMTFLEAHDVVGWHRHTTEGKFGSAAVIEGLMEDDLWAAVARTIDGSDVIYIEFMESRFDDDDTTEACFLDSAITVYVSSPVREIPGPYFWSLAGEEVACVIDGAYYGLVTVGADGSVEVNQDVTVSITLGFPYTSTMKTVRPEIPSQRGTNQGRKKYVSKVGFRFYKTVGGLYGPDEDHLYEIDFRTPAMDVNAPVEPFTGDTDFLSFPGDSADNHGGIMVQQRDPMPMTIIAIMPEIEIVED
jgi:hypothetical protein